jgi:hypothetical protein
MVEDAQRELKINKVILITWFHNWL